MYVSAPVHEPVHGSPRLSPHAAHTTSPWQARPPATTRRPSDCPWTARSEDGAPIASQATRVCTVGSTYVRNSVVGGSTACPRVRMGPLPDWPYRSRRFRGDAGAAIGLKVIADTTEAPARAARCRCQRGHPSGALSCSLASSPSCPSMAAGQPRTAELPSTCTPVLDLSPRPGLRRQGGRDLGPVPGYWQRTRLQPGDRILSVGCQALHPGPRPRPLLAHRPGRARHAGPGRARIRPPRCNR